MDQNLFGVFEIEDLVEQEDFDMTMYFDDFHFEQGGRPRVVFVMP